MMDKREIKGGIYDPMFGLVRNVANYLWDNFKVSLTPYLEERIGYWFEAIIHGLVRETMDHVDIGVRILQELFGFGVPKRATQVIRRF